MFDFLSLILLFIFGCAESLFLCELFLSSKQVEATLYFLRQGGGGPSCPAIACCRARALGHTRSSNCGYRAQAQ